MDCHYAGKDEVDFFIRTSQIIILHSCKHLLGVFSHSNKTSAV